MNRTCSIKNPDPLNQYRAQVPAAANPAAATTAAPAATAATDGKATAATDGKATDGEATAAGAVQRATVREGEGDAGAI